MSRLYKLCILIFANENLNFTELTKKHRSPKSLCSLPSLQYRKKVIQAFSAFMAKEKATRKDSSSHLFGGFPPWRRRKKVWQVRTLTVSTHVFSKLECSYNYFPKSSRDPSGSVHHFQNTWSMLPQILFQGEANLVVRSWIQHTIFKMLKYLKRFSHDMHLVRCLISCLWDNRTTFLDSTR